MSAEGESRWLLFPEGLLSEKPGLRASHVSFYSILARGGRVITIGPVLQTRGLRSRVVKTLPSCEVRPPHSSWEKVDQFPASQSLFNSRRCAPTPWPPESTAGHERVLCRCPDSRHSKVLKLLNSPRMRKGSPLFQCQETGWEIPLKTHLKGPVRIRSVQLH